MKQASPGTGASANIDFEQLFASVPEAYLLFAVDDPTFTVVAENRAHAKLKLTKFLAFHRAKLVSSLRTVISTGKPHTLVLHCPPEVGSRRIEKWWQLTHFPITDAHGKVTYIGQHSLDISKQERQLKLEQTRSMFNALFESSILSIIVANNEGKIFEANPKFLKTLGYARADLRRGMNVLEVTPGYAFAKRDQMIADLNRTGSIAPTERDFISKKGAIIPMMVGAAMLPDSDDRFISFMLDVSENKVLKALNVAKDEFVALASHQLRTPATAVKQYLGILIEEYAGPVTPDQLQYLNIAYNSNERQLTIINDLLKTALLDTKGYRLLLADANINRLLTEIASDFKPILGAKRQSLHLLPTKEPLHAKIDRAELKLALTNLVENASKYSMNGSTITVKLARSKGFITIAVSDQGVGIAKANLDIIFEKFTRIDNPLSDTVSGTGLGLYWVKRIIDLHSGTLKVTSEIRKGTTFTIRLPLV